MPAGCRCCDLSISPAPARRGCSASPAKGRIAVGYDADLTVVDLKRRETITDALDRLARRLDAL